MLEVHPEGVQPEPVEVLGVAHGDVPGNTLVEPELPEQTEGRRQALLAVQPFLLHRVELGEEAQVGKRRGHAENLRPRSESRPVPARLHLTTSP